MRENSNVRIEKPSYHKTTSTPTLSGYLRHFWQYAEKDQRFLTVLGLLSIVASFGCVITYLILGGPLEGSMSWRKPILFALFLGIMQLNLAWLLNYMPYWKTREIISRLVMGIAISVQITLIVLQQARGTLSHFNWFTGPLNAWIARVLIVVAVLVFIGNIIITWKLFKPIKLEESTKRLLRFGMVMLCVGPMLGGAIIANTFHSLFVLGIRDMNDFHTFGAEGNLLVPHLFALNVLPMMTVLLALFYKHNLKENVRLRIVNLFSFTSIAFLLHSSYQTFSGLAPLNFNVVSGTLFILIMLSFFYCLFLLFTHKNSIVMNEVVKEY